MTPFGASDWNTNDFAAITGAFTWTTEGFNGHEFHYNAANTFSSYVSNANDRHKIKADAAGALGTGDVTINQRGDQISPNRSAELSLNVQDTIADTATLYLNGPSGGGGFAGNGINWVIVADGVNETVHALYLYGIQQGAGTYNGGNSTTDWIGGTGSITVTTGTAPVDPIINDIEIDGGGNVILTLDDDPAGLTVQAYDDFNPGTFVDISSTPGPGANQLTVDALDVDPNMDGADFYRVRR